MTKKIITSFIFILVIVSAVLFSIPKQTYAQGLPVTDVHNTFLSYLGNILAGTTSGSTAVNTSLHLKDFAKEILRQVVITVEHKLIASVTQSTVNWINSGFSGSPLYVQNPTSFFKDIGKFEVKNLVDQYGYDPVRFPFGKSFALNTINSYKSTLQNDAQYSLSKVIHDPVLLNNYRNNFNTGGWNGFLINTQYPQNNYLGYTMMMNNTLAQRLAGTTQNAAQNVQTTLQQGNGFLSPKTCPSNPSYNNGVNEFKQPSFDSSKVSYNVPDCISPVAGTSVACQNQADIDEAIKSGSFVPQCITVINTAYGSSNGCINQDAINAALIAYNNAYDAQKATWDKTNSCPGGLVATTPGSVVGNQIMSALDSNHHLGELDAALGNSVATILDSLMNHFMSQGLSAISGSSNSTSTPVDTWSYNGNTLDGGTNTTGSQPLNVPTSVSVKTGSTAPGVTITGGIPPYIIKTQPNTTIATAQVGIQSNVLTVTGISAGQTSFVIQDSSSPSKTASVQITTSKSGNLVVDFNNPSALKNISVDTSGTNLTISGGIQPYNISSKPDTSVALAMISENTLSLVGINPGTTSITLQDSSTSPKTINLQITMGGQTVLIINPQNIIVSVENSTNATISGGVAPYTLISQPNSSVASVAVSGNNLVIIGTGAGNTSATIQDSSSPAETITIPIAVGAGVGGSSTLPTGTGTNGTF